MNIAWLNNSLLKMFWNLVTRERRACWGRKGLRCFFPLLLSLPQSVSHTHTYAHSHKRIRMHPDFYRFKSVSKKWINPWPAMGNIHTDSVENINHNSYNTKIVLGIHCAIMQHCNTCVATRVKASGVAGMRISVQNGFQKRGAKRLFCWPSREVSRLRPDWQSARPVLGVIGLNRAPGPIIGLNEMRVQVKSPQDCCLLIYVWDDSPGHEYCIESAATGPR